MSKKTLKMFLALAVVAVVVAVGFVVATKLEKINQLVPDGAGTSTVFVGNTIHDPVPTPEVQDIVNFDGKDYRFRKELSTLLILGTDDELADEDTGHLVDSQADFVVLAILNEEEKTCQLLQISRNTMTNVDILDEHDQVQSQVLEQICLAHDYGSTPEIRCRNTANALSRLLYDVPVERYVSLTMGGIIALNDTAGGVTVTIEDDFTGVDDTLVKGQTMTLMGEHAYNFVHARMNMQDDPTNSARMRRHRAYMSALVDQVRAKMAQDGGFALDMLDAVADYMVTDCELDELSDYANGLAEYTLSGIITPEGESEYGGESEEFYPDEEALMQLVLELFYEPV